jgi:hypothetical protein
MTPPCQHRGRALGVYGNGGAQVKHGSKYGDKATHAEAEALLGIGWGLTTRELSQAIPPAYTEYPGRLRLIPPR